MNDRHTIPDGSQAGSPKTSTTGVVVFSPTGRLLHINEQALNVLRDVDGEDAPTESPIEASALPSVVLDLQQEIVARIEQRAEVGDWALFEVKRLVRLAGRNVTLRGFGVPDHRSPRQSRVIITIQEAAATCEAVMAFPLAPTVT